MVALHALLLFVVALLGGTLNAVAGGGSFLTVPTLIFLGVPPINANATSTTALWPGSVASVGAYRSEIAPQRAIIIRLSLISLVGGIIGAVVLLHTPQNVFLRLLPFLLALATALFAFGPRLTALQRQSADVSRRNTGWLAPVVQFIISIYAGFFGGGIGILMLSMLTLMGMTNIHAMNGIKTVLAAVSNGVAVVLFVFAGIINWGLAIVMLVGALLGGYYGAYFARKIDSAIIRRFVIAVGIVVTIILFIEAYL